MYRNIAKSNIFENKGDYIYGQDSVGVVPFECLTGIQFLFFTTFMILSQKHCLSTTDKYVFD